jgi:hypothetical protein
MDERGLTVAETARRVREALGEDAKFTAANISHYRQGRSVPRPRYLDALSSALGMSRSDLVAGTPASPGELHLKPHLDNDRRDVQNAALSGLQASALPSFDIKDQGGTAWIQINQQLPWPVAIKILQALKGDTREEGYSAK